MSTFMKIEDRTS